MYEKMRSKTCQRLMLEEYEYCNNPKSYDEVKREMNEERYGYAMTNKELINHLDKLSLITLTNRDEDGYCYTETNDPSDEFTYTKNDVHVNKNGKKIYSYR